MEALNKAEKWTEVHTDAMRSLLIKDIVVAKNNDRFLEFIGGDAGELADIGKRFALYHTPSFKRMNKEVFSKLSKNVIGRDKKIIDDFMGRETGVVVWNDTDNARIGDRVEKMLSDKNTSWRKILGDREDPGSFDSISFISENYKRILELYYGVSKEGSNIFKPVISSNGDNNLLFAKTVFVYDPDIDFFFNKNKNLDILTTASADKLHSAITVERATQLNQLNRPLLINKSPEDLLNMNAKGISEHMFTIPMEAVGVSIIPDNVMNARFS